MRFALSTSLFFCRACNGWVSTPRYRRSYTKVHCHERALYFKTTLFSPSNTCMPFLPAICAQANLLIGEGPDPNIVVSVRHAILLHSFVLSSVICQRIIYGVCFPPIKCDFSVTTFFFWFSEHFTYFYDHPFFLFWANNLFTKF